MISSKNSNTHILRLNKGEFLQDTLQRFTAQNNILGGWISGLGTALQMTLGFYDMDKQQYKWQDFNGFYEVTALQGNIALGADNKPIFHLHGTFAGEDYRAFGGHVKDITVAATLELYIQPIEGTWRRTHDAATGLNLLDFNGRS